MTAVEKVFSTIFWAVPAFMRVDPVMASGPVFTRIGTSAFGARAAKGLDASSTVRAPRERPMSSAPPT